MNRPLDSLLGSIVLGRYRIVRKLARGGMGAVYLARTEGAEGFTRPVVVKRVLPALMDDPEIAQLFVREARILANLQHPNIVGVLDFGQQDDGAYVTVFEYVSGYSLGEWGRFLKRSRSTTSCDVMLHIVGRVLDALEYAHTFTRSDGKQLQIVHRDISPSNILLTDQGTVKLVDFGIAQVSGDETVIQTENPRIRGKLPYVPVEIFRGEAATVQTDIYAAGVVLYELITGINPFAGRETADIYHKVAYVVPPSVHSTRDDAPEDIDAVLARALDRDTKQRYGSAAEFAAALRALRKEQDDVVARELGDRLKQDFASALPEALGLETLGARDEAWRNATPSAANSSVTVVPPPAASALPFGPRPSLPPGEQVTVHVEISPALLLEAVRSNAPDPQRPERPAPRRVAVAAVVLLVLAGAAFAAWLAVREPPSPQPVVVLERPPARRPPDVATKPDLPVPNAAGLPSTGEADQPEAAAAEPIVTAVASAQTVPDPTAKRDPLRPNPRALTRAFERRHKLVESCFDQHAAAIQGEPQLSLHFSVGASGQVLSTELEPGALAGTSLGRCLLEVARTTRFPPQQEELSFHIPITAERAP